ncbi:hypothetical protein VT03_25490 [Planctomyces sp. SH-PL14]|nr:hypothetical protein VT03_25490 [Planctomyces sp. SH-PL14]
MSSDQDRATGLLKAHRLTGSRGYPWWGMQGGEASLPAGGLAVERRLKEIVSKRGQGAGCPRTNPRGFLGER